MGEVYLAEDPRLGRQVAIKVLNPKTAADEAGQERLRQEARMAARLDHPNICTLHEIGTDGDVDYLVMQRLQGETLAERLARGPMERAGLDIAVQLTEALAYAHAHGVIHRDIKPQNVMVTPEGRVKLMDFGLAKAPGHLDAQDETRAALTAPGVFLGTLQYMAPEQLEGHAADHRSDIFSLAMVLYQLFASKHPFAGATTAATITAITSRPAPRLSETAPHAPAGLDRILAKALNRDPEERYQSTADLLVDLREVQRAAAAPAIPAPSSSAKRSFGPIKAAAVVLLLAAAGAAYLWLPAPAPAPAATPATASTPGPAAPLHSMTSWLEIKPVRAGVPQDTYESIGGDTMAETWEFRVHVMPSAPGYLTVLSDETRPGEDGGILTVLHQMAAIGPRDLTDWNIIGGPPSEHAIWVIWSATPVELLENLQAFEKDAGIVRDQSAARRVRDWLQESLSPGTTSVADDARRLIRQGTGSELVQRFLVKH